MSPSAAPRVSVIIPCYDLGRYLDEAVGSVLAQTYQDFEIIVVDDGSMEPETLALIEDYRRPKTRVVRAAHGGLAAARNMGIAHAQGDLLCALDADDRLAPSFLEKTVRALDDDPAIAFASCWLRAFGDEAWEWRPERCDLPALLSEDTILTAALVRRDAVASAGGYDTAMPVQGDEDWDLWLTLVERGYHGVIIPEVLFDYRRRAGSMSTVCWHGPGHLPLAGYRIAKHAAAYRAHLRDVLLRQDAETVVLLRRNDELERYIATDLEPSVALRRREVASLQSRFASTTPAPADAAHSQSLADAECIRHLDTALEAAAAEVAALRNSASWRVTAPLRRLYGWWLGMRGPS
ncbi:MAG TPA: glycosyltransferase family A protein [Vicinamibacterales bacterium]|jgi:glycosyltransferase involved in cell wall biosynthesis|nr:glycosyltransferase family A protein [Vicinamibacterales bacterium]